MRRMNQHALVLVCLCGSGCTGFVAADADESDEPAAVEGALSVLKFVARDARSGIYAQACLEERGEDDCPAHENPHYCDTADVAIMPDGRTHLTCRQGKSVVVARFADDFDDQLVLCTTNPQNRCVVCNDKYGHLAFDTCFPERASNLFRSRGTGQWLGAVDTLGSVVGFGLTNEMVGPTEPNGSGGAAGSGTVTPPLKVEAEDDCALAVTVNKVNAAMASMLRQEGLNWPFGGVPAASAGGGFFANNRAQDPFKQFAAGARPQPKNPELFITPSHPLANCPAVRDAQRCFCDPVGPMLMCYGNRLGNTVPLRRYLEVAACANRAEHVAQLTVARGAIVEFLNNMAKASRTNPSITGGQFQQITINASPLVIDLDGDGVSMSTADAGVLFDLNGQGPVRTAWPVAGDALLALDRDGNGRIDSGAELFGELTPLGDGTVAEDGFSALGALDRPAHGGNGDGTLDDNDLMFGAVLVWRDADRDGASAQGELRGLDALGIASIPLQHSAGLCQGGAGNPYGQHGWFTRRDGSKGQLVDVYFSHRAD